MDTRYIEGVVQTYASEIAKQHGGNPSDYGEACRKFVYEHKDWHESNRWDFKFKEGFLDDILACI